MDIWHLHADMGKKTVVSPNVMNIKWKFKGNISNSSQHHRYNVVIINRALGDIVYFQKSVIMNGIYAFLV